MLLDIKTRLFLAGAVVASSLVTAAAVEPQIDTSSGVTTTSSDHISPTTHTAPPVTGTLPTPSQPPTDPNANSATGGSGLEENPAPFRGSDLAPSPSSAGAPTSGAGERPVGEANSSTRPAPNYSLPNPGN